jgi:hypothetical protein
MASIVTAAPEFTGVVRVEDALLMIEQNRARTKGTAPSAALLPVEPLKPFPPGRLESRFSA